MSVSMGVASQRRVAFARDQHCSQGPHCSGISKSKTRQIKYASLKPRTGSFEAVKRPLKRPDRVYPLAKHQESRRRARQRDRGASSLSLLLAIVQARFESSEH